MDLGLDMCILLGSSLVKTTTASPIMLRTSQAITGKRTAPTTWQPGELKKNPPIDGNTGPKAKPGLTYSPRVDRHIRIL